MSLLAEQAFVIFAQHMKASVADKVIWVWSIARVHCDLQRHFEYLICTNFNRWHAIYDSVLVGLYCARCGKRGSVDKPFNMCDKCLAVINDNHDDYDDYADLDNDYDNYDDDYADLTTYESCTKYEISEYMWHR